jgi:ABC-type amino acid transport substrate-binding protein
MVWTALLLFLAPPLVAQEDEVTRKLVVGTKPTEPFVIRGADGGWEGISIELWEDIAAEAGWTYEYREYSLEELIEAVRTGSVDVAVAAFTVTAERERELDFSHPFYSTGLGLGVATKGRRALGRILWTFLSREFLRVIGALAVVLLIFGLLVWLFERRRNLEQFGGKAVQGIGSGFWWSAVTMTTVGYGDKAPRTFGGRIVGLVWMFAGIIMISTFTAAITSSLTVSHLEHAISGPDDLPRVRVGSVQASAPAASLEERGISYRDYESLDAAVRAIVDDEIDVVVYDAPILRYRIKLSFQGEAEVLPRTFERQDYALMFPVGSPLREQTNRALLRIVRRPSWGDLIQRYLGE